MDGINPSHMDDYWREYEAKRDITGTINNKITYHMPHMISIKLYPVIYGAVIVLNVRYMIYRISPSHSK